MTEIECCYRDCLRENQKLEIAGSGREGEVFVCPCERKRLMVWREIEGRATLFPMGQRYHPRTGQTLTNDPPVIMQFRGESRGSLGGWKSIVDDLPEIAYDPYPVAGVPGNACLGSNILQVPPPVIGGGYLAHRALDSEEWYFWSIATGKLEHKVMGGEGLGLAAAPIGEISGIGFLVTPNDFHHYTVLPELDPDPLVVKLTSPACPNAAPLMTAQNRSGEVAFESRKVFIATETGLQWFDFNECLASGQPARFRECQGWTGDPRLFWPPVYFPDPDKRGSGAVVTFHANGWAYVTWLDKRGVPAGADAIRIAEGNGHVLLPPAVTREGLWCQVTSPQVTRIGLVENPAQLHNPPVWQNVNWRSQETEADEPVRDETLAWTPLVADSQYQSRGNVWGTGISRVVYLNNRGLVFLDRNRLNLVRGHSALTIRSETMPTGFKSCAAFARAQREQILLFDILTARLCLFDARTRTWTEHAALNPTVLSNLLGGPVWCGESVIWPTRMGLHTIKIHANHGEPTG
ncbi:MAG TPA: hypothetical protein PK878_15140 [bacterium]|nr:hypothetical protein [bacterium]